MSHAIILLIKVPRQIVEALHMRWASNPDTALHMSLDQTGPTASIIAVQNAISTLIQPATASFLIFP